MDHAERQPGKLVCWPIIWLWVLAIAQYSYRYILQVNDPGSSISYAVTPAPLSAIKYALLLLFAAFAGICAWRRPASASRTYRMLLGVSAAAIVIFFSLLFVRLALSPGALDETATCALKLIPWMASACFIPLVFRSRHSLAQTLASFETITFWILFPFWLTTVVLAIFDVRYPALSYPGLLVRFGGILDDPNGYACLCLLLAVLATTFRTRYWKLRTIVYVAMLLGTVSLAGYATAMIIVIGFLLRRGQSRPMSTVAICGAATVIVAIAIVAYQTSDTVSAITSLYDAKSNSATAHLSDLVPDEAAWDGSSPVALLCGAGGFSENFYWEILANFGWIGLVTVVGVLVSWCYVAFRHSDRLTNAIGIWSVAVLIGSNGIAYLLTFPINLIFWSMLGLLICARDQKAKQLFSQNRLHQVATL
jgi:hypothetical protein